MLQYPINPPSRLENRIYAAIAIIAIFGCITLNSYMFGAIDQHTLDAKNEQENRTRAEQFLADYTANVYSDSTEQAKQILAQEGYGNDR